VIAACCKWVDLRPEVDPLDAHVRTDPRTAGCSAADAAALEWALRAGDRWDQPVLAVTAGPPEAERVLRDAVAAGATRAVRIALPTSAPSAVVATAIAAVLGTARITSVWCGDHSLDRGSGAVPAFLAAELGSAQALGLVGVELDARAGRVDAWRRLDRGRREHVRLDGPGVLSVEGSTARLRRAALGAVMSSGRTTIEVATPAAAVFAAPLVGPARVGRLFRRQIVDAPHRFALRRERLIASVDQRPFADLGQQAAHPAARFAEDLSDG
jgi:electron transfer flavoprotein beta subunit